MMLCAMWYHLSNLKNVRNIHGGVLLLVKLQAFSITYVLALEDKKKFVIYLRLIVSGDSK